MRKLSIFMWGIFFSIFVFKSSFTQPPDTESVKYSVTTFQTYLVEAGLENIQIQLARNQTIWISYENRSYRNEVTALSIVLEYASECLQFADHFVIIPKYRNVPIKYIKVSREIFRYYLNGEISATDFIEHLELSFQPFSENPLVGYGFQNVQSSLLNIDIIASPGVRAQFARPGDPAQMQFNLLTDISTTVLKGLQFNSQWVFPLYDEFQTGKTHSHIGKLYLNHFIKFPSETYLSLSAGLFELGCSGFSTAIQQLFFTDRLSLSARFDYLNTHSLKHTLQLDEQCDNNLSYLFQARYRFDRVNFSTKITWGRFLLGDTRWRIDVVRQFHELELGFMGVWNESLEFLTGMTVRIPFPVSRQPRPAPMRIRTPRFIPWDYRYLPCYDGFILDTGNQFEQIAQQLSFSYLRANIHQFKTATRYVKFNQPNPLFAEKGNE